MYIYIYIRIYINTLYDYCFVLQRDVMTFIKRQKDLKNHFASRIDTFDSRLAELESKLP